jgi:hypothetical protein
MMCTFMEPEGEATFDSAAMSNARPWLAFVGETRFPPRAPFFLTSWGTSRFPTPLHAQGSAGAAP